MVKACVRQMAGVKTMLPVGANYTHGRFPAAMGAFNRHKSRKALHKCLALTVNSCNNYRPSSISIHMLIQLDDCFYAEGADA